MVVGSDNGMGSDNKMVSDIGMGSDNSSMSYPISSHVAEAFPPAKQGTMVLNCA